MTLSFLFVGCRGNADMVAVAVLIKAAPVIDWVQLGSSLWHCQEQELERAALGNCMPRLPSTILKARVRKTVNLTCTTSCSPATVEVARYQDVELCERPTSPASSAELPNWRHPDSPFCIMRAAVFTCVEVWSIDSGFLRWHSIFQRARTACNSHHSCRMNGSTMQSRKLHFQVRQLVTQDFLAERSRSIYSGEHSTCKPWQAVLLQDSGVVRHPQE